MTTPHSSWAEFYDTAYKESFGASYQYLTKTTLEQIMAFVSKPSQIVDFGAGTGRLTIPLALKGYQVVAVEPCKEMLNQLKEKPGGNLITAFVGRMQDFQSNIEFDMAICVFTVLLYLLDEDALDKSFEAAANALRTDGLLLIDIPSRGVFSDYSTSTENIQRIVRVASQGGDLYVYEENATVHRKNSSVSYSDKFTIRYWEQKHVLAVLAKHGFSKERYLSDAFYGAGSQYFLMKKTMNLTQDEEG